MGNKRIIISLLVVVASAFILFQIYARFFDVSPRSVAVNGHKIRVEIADTQDKQFKGLSDRAKLCDDCGMLFLFQDRVQRAFVMRNMKFSLDMIFIDGDKVVKIFENLKPEGANPTALYQSGRAVTKVLEVNAGTAKKLNIKTGDIIK